MIVLYSSRFLTKIKLFVENAPVPRRLRLLAAPEETVFIGGAEPWAPGRQKSAGVKPCVQNTGGLKPHTGQ